MTSFFAFWLGALLGGTIGSLAIAVLMAGDDD